MSLRRPFASFRREGVLDACLTWVDVAAMAAVAVAAVAVGGPLHAGTVDLIRGDANGDGRTNITDPVFVLGHLFQGKPTILPCSDAADSNHDGKVELSDAAHSLAFLFLGGPRPVPLETDCGVSLSLISSRLDFLRAIFPDKLPAELQDVPMDPLVLGRASRQGEDGAVALTAGLLVFDAMSRALVSVDLCHAPADPGCGQVRLHYDRQGFAEEQGSPGVAGVLSQQVQSLRLQSGWTLVFDLATRNLLAFREEAPRSIVDDVDGDGVPEARTLAYRSDVGPDGKPSTASENFGRGNGVLLSVVVEGQDWIDPPRIPSEPEISRIAELEENKVLVFFASGTVQSLQLLELHEETATRDFDLNPPARQSELLDVKVLKGVRKAFPGAPLNAFLAYSTIAQQVTQNQALILDSFQPIGLPGSRALLVFDRNTSSFLKVAAARDPASLEIAGGTVATAAPQETVLTVLIEAAGAGAARPPLIFSGRFQHRTSPEVCLFEEKAASLLAFDPGKEPRDSLRILLTSRDFLGNNPGRPPKSCSLVFATADLPQGRLAFDRGLGQILNVDYAAGFITRIADRRDLAGTTGSPTVDLSYLEPLDDHEVRLLDRSSASLLRLGLR